MDVMRLHPLASSSVNNAHFYLLDVSLSSTQSVAGPCQTSSSVLHHPYCTRFIFFPSLYCRSIWSAEGLGRTVLASLCRSIRSRQRRLVCSLIASFIAEVTLEESMKMISHVLWRGGLLSPREEKCSSPEQLFIDCNNLDPAVLSLTRDNQLWILISLPRRYRRLREVCNCSLCVCAFTFHLFPRLYWIMSLSDPQAPYLSSTVQQP